MAKRAAESEGAGRLAAGERLRVVSWNVNGLRAATEKGFRTWLGRRSRAQVVGVQEVRARPEQLAPDVARPRGWSTWFVPAERAGYSGVGLFSRVAPDETWSSLEEPDLDREGRLQAARFGRLWVVNAYFPKGSGAARDNSRVPYKLRFYQRLFDVLAGPLRAGERLLLLGDLNTAHEPRDLARPQGNTKTSGFLPEERAELSRWLAAGWVDTFRAFQPDGGHYSWWSQRSGCRERNVGWRIDYVLASPAAMPFVRAASIHGDVRGSDHCPVSVDLDPRAVL